MRIRLNAAMRFCAGIAVFGLALSIFALAATACIAYQPFDPDETLKHNTRESIARTSEVIVEGVVEPYEPAGPQPADHTGITKMRVDRVWKGDLGPVVVVLFPTASSDCSRPPPFGERIRFSAYPLEKSSLLKYEAFALIPQRRELLESYDDVLYYGRGLQGLPFDLPLQDPVLDRILLQYQTQTEILEKHAVAGSKEEQLAFAKHLSENNETHRALNVYNSVFQAHPDDLDLLLTVAAARARAPSRGEPEATFAEVERRAPKTDEWRGKIARTRFAATGKFTPGWMDWTDLPPTRSPYCENRNMNFDGASFDRSDLSGCDFQSSSFRQSSFLGTDLSHIGYGYGPGPIVDMSGAKYDCATKLPDDLDPVAAGMINIEGSCHAP